LAPLLAGLGGRNADDATAFRTWRLGGELSASGDRESFVLARACTEAAIPLDDQGSAGQRALASADLLIRLPPHSRALASGDVVQALCF
ncbi:MAG: molybdopterin molybdenumtransferase MoeA, partial [Hyphomonadaceae bacterium]